MHAASLLVSLGSLAACAEVMPPPVPLPPVYADINSEHVRQQRALEQAAALSMVDRSQHNVSRIFIVGWESHYGYDFLVPSDLNSRVMPDIVGDTVRAKFASETSQEVLAAHVGQRLICECEGVEWSHYGPRFLVRKAEFRWE